MNNKLTIDQRKKRLIDSVFKKFKEDAVFAEGTNINSKKEWVEDSFSLNKKYVQHQFEIFDLSEVYNIEQLKKDVAELFLKE